MVQVTKGKNVVIETYDAEFKEFTATAAQTDFTMANKAGETTPEYTRHAKGQERRIQRPAGYPDEGINKDHRDSRAG